MQVPAGSADARLCRMRALVIRSWGVPARTGVQYDDGPDPVGAANLESRIESQLEEE